MGIKLLFSTLNLNVVKSEDTLQNFDNFYPTFAVVCKSLLGQMVKRSMRSCV